MDILNFSDKLYNWIHIWVKVTFSPRKFILELVTAKTQKTNRGLWFFTGSQLVAFFAMFFISLFYFSFFSDHRFSTPISKYGLGVLGLAGLLFISFCTLNLILTLINSLVTYTFYRPSKVAITSKKHTNILFYLSNLDFVSFSCIVLLFLHNHINWLTYALIILYGLVKIYYLSLAFLFLCKTYRLSGAQAIGPFAGFIINYLVFNLVFWLLIL